MHVHGAHQHLIWPAQCVQHVKVQQTLHADVAPWHAVLSNIRLCISLGYFACTGCQPGYNACGFIPYLYWRAAAGFLLICWPGPHHSQRM